MTSTRSTGRRGEAPGPADPPRRLAFVGTGSGRNLGDRAMLLAQLAFYRSLGVTGFDVPDDLPEPFRREFGARGYPLFYHCLGRYRLERWPAVLHWVPWLTTIALCALLLAWRRWRRRALPMAFMEAAMVNTLSEADAVVFSGGGYLTDVGRLECRGCLLTGLIALALGKPVLMTGQGIGPFDSGLTRRLMGWVARRARFIAVRDPQESAACLASIGVDPERVQACGDDAFSLADHGPAAEAAPEGRTLAVHYRESSVVAASERLRRAYAELVRAKRAQGWRIRYFVFSGRPAEELDRLAGIDPALDATHEVVRSDDPRHLCLAMRDCTVAVGLAYHFVVFALVNGVPVIGLYGNDYYRQKMQGLLQWFDRQAWATPTATLDGDGLVRLVASIEACGARDDLTARAQALIARQQAAYASALPPRP